MTATDGESVASSGGAARSNPTGKKIENVVRRTRTATDNLRTEKYLKNARRQKSIRPNVNITMHRQKAGQHLVLSLNYAFTRDLQTIGLGFSYCPQTAERW